MKSELHGEFLADADKIIESLREGEKVIRAFSRGETWDIDYGDVGMELTRLADKFDPPKGPLIYQCEGCKARLAREDIEGWKEAEYGPGPPWIHWLPEVGGASSQCGEVHLVGEEQ